MSERGYLWEALREEIEEEFAAASADLVAESEISRVAGKLRWREYCEKSIADREAYALEQQLRPHLRKMREAAHARRLAARAEKRKPMPTRGSRTKTVAEVRAEIANKPGDAEVQFKWGDDPRERLPDEREGFTIKATLIAADVGDKPRELDVYIQPAAYPDGRLAEVFVKLGKSGSAEALLEQWSIAFSVALQLGADVDKLCDKFLHTQFEPAGFVRGVPGVKSCTSLVDLVCQVLKLKYGKKEEGSVE